MFFLEYSRGLKSKDDAINQEEYTIALSETAGEGKWERERTWLQMFREKKTRGKQREKKRETEKVSPA